MADLNTANVTRASGETRWACLGPVLSGLLIAAVFPPLNWTWLVWGALVPLAWALRAAQWGRREYLGAYVGGAVCFWWGLDWIGACYAAPGELGPYFWGWLAVGFVAGWFWMGLAWFARRLLRTTAAPMTIVLPAVWVSAEAAARYAIAGLDQTGSTWLRIGSVLADWPTWAQFAAIGGELGLSAIVGLANGAACDLLVYLMERSWRTARRWRLSPAATAAALACVWWCGAERLRGSDPPDGPTIVLCGENDLPPLILTDRIPGAQGEPPDLVVWPELAFHDSSAAGMAGLVHCSRDLRAAIVMGGERVATADNSDRRTGRYNAALFAAPDRDGIAHYDKRRPTPWAEYLPWQDLWPAGPRGRFDRGAAARTFQFTARSGRAQRFACLICYDLCFADIAREAADDNVDFLVHLGAEGQDASGALPLLMERTAKLRAIETGRPMVRNVSGGYSGIIDSRGEWTAGPIVGDITTPVNLGPAPLLRRTTWYALIGDVWVGVVAGWVILAPACLAWFARLRDSMARCRSVARHTAPATYCWLRGQ